MSELKKSRITDELLQELDKQLELMSELCLRNHEISVQMYYNPLPDEGDGKKETSQPRDFVTKLKLRLERMAYLNSTLEGTIVNMEQLV